MTMRILPKKIASRHPWLVNKNKWVIKSVYQRRKFILFRSDQFYIPIKLFLKIQSVKQVSYVRIRWENVSVSCETFAFCLIVKCSIIDFNSRRRFYFNAIIHGRLVLKHGRITRLSFRKKNTQIINRKLGKNAEKWRQKENRVIKRRSKKKYLRRNEFSSFSTITK